LFASDAQPEAGRKGEWIMHMQRHYFISDNLDDLEVFEEQLEAAGISTPQIHVLSRDDAEVEHHHHLHEVQSFMKNDIVHLTMRGAAVGICAFVLVLVVAYIAGWTETAAGWTPVVFLAVVLLGFCTWEGGLLGIQKPNHNFARFEAALRDGKHIFFVDLEPQQEAVLEKVLQSHPKVEQAGTGVSTRHWLIALQQKAMIRHS
jgi:hypothetical protein